MILCVARLLGEGTIHIPPVRCASFTVHPSHRWRHSHTTRRVSTLYTTIHVFLYFGTHTLPVLDCKPYIDILYTIFSVLCFVRSEKDFASWISHECIALHWVELSQIIVSSLTVRLGYLSERRLYRKTDNNAFMIFTYCKSHCTTYYHYGSLT